MLARCGTIVLVFQRTFATIIDHEVSSLAISSYISAMIVSLASREVLKLRFRCTVGDNMRFKEFSENICGDCCNGAEGWAFQHVGSVGIDLQDENLFLLENVTLEFPVILNCVSPFKN
ncbi:hypothetical protein Tco_0556133 [Tanacetum coccineum]